MILSRAANDGDPCTYAVCRFVCSAWKDILPPRPSFLWTTCSAAARGGYLAVLQWARANGCPWGPRGMSRAEDVAGFGTSKIPQEDSREGYQSVPFEAARGGHIDVLEWLSRSGCPWDHLAYYAAAEGDQLKALLWLSSRYGAPLSQGVFKVAAVHGSTNVLRWAKEGGRWWNASICAEAACAGKFSTLEWLVENECPWDASMLSFLEHPRERLATIADGEARLRVMKKLCEVGVVKQSFYESEFALFTEAHKGN